MKQIKNRHTGEVICDGQSLQEVLEKHKKWLLNHEDGERADFSDADLCGANFSGVYFYAATFSGATFSGVNFLGANFYAATFSGATFSGGDWRDTDLSDTDLSGADLSGANFSGADLSGVNFSDADLSGAYFSGANFSGADLSGVPFIENIHQKVYEAASKEGALDMKFWHTCETTHCRAGWVVALAGDAGKELESRTGTPAAAALIYLKSDPNIRVMPTFYAGNESALEDMKERAEKEKKRNNNGE